MKELNGKDVWRLYDTYGFPVDLTLLMAEELGLGVNHDEFEAAQAASKEASKASLKVGAKDVLKLDVHDIAALEKDASVPKTDDSAKFGKYSVLLASHLSLILRVGIGNIDATVKAIYHKKAFLQSTSDIAFNTIIGVLLDRTSFYAEAGGQEYDTGNIVIDGVADFEVTNVQVFNGYVLHIGQLKYGQLSVGDTVVSSYDEVSQQYLFSSTAYQKWTSSDAGHFVTITRQPTFLTLRCARLSVTTSIRKGRLSHQQSSASIFPTKRKYHFQNWSASNA